LWNWGLACLSVVLLGACERPFVEVSTPGLEVVAPDLSTVLLDARVTISVSASSFRSLREVTLNGLPMMFDPAQNRWDLTLELSRGLNTLILEAADIEDVAGVDTAYAVLLPSRFIPNGPPLPSPRGGHTATILRDGSLLVLGGAEAVGGPAQGDAFQLSPTRSGFVRLSTTLNFARTGHTATRLPDERVLILGGSRSDDVAGIADLVEEVEIFDPATMRFDAVPFEGQPIRRTLHTAALRNTAAGVFIDLYGGRGDIRYDDDPRLGTRRDLRTFEFVNDTLIARNTLASAPFLDAAIAGHTETQVPFGSYFIFGSFFDDQFADEASFAITYTSPSEFSIEDTPPLLTPRTRHAAGTLAGDFLIILGGRQALPSQTLDETELFSVRTRRFFRLPGTVASVKRFGHTATNLSAQRILLVGGFGTNGNSLTLSEFFDASLVN